MIHCYGIEYACTASGQWLGGRSEQGRERWFPRLDYWRTQCLIIVADAIGAYGELIGASKKLRGCQWHLFELIHSTGMCNLATM